MGNETFLKTGLSEKEVQKLKSEGKDNKIKEEFDKSIFQILKDNFIELFSIVLYIIFFSFLILRICLVSNGMSDLANEYVPFSRFIFIVPSLINSIIGVITEIRSKKVIKKIKLVNGIKNFVIRDGEKKEILKEDLVEGDLIYFTLGDQISCDCRLVSGEVEVDESMLTGESEPIKKENIEGKDSLLSGSYIVSGNCLAIALKVGENTYVSNLSNKVKILKSKKSELMRSVNKLLNIMSIILFVVFILVFSSLIIKIALYGNDSNVFGTTLEFSSIDTWLLIFTTSCSYAITVIPSGLLFMSSISLGTSVIKLANEKTLVQDLYSLENLSRVDILCLDKTGTLTSGEMEVIDIKIIKNNEDIERYLSTIVKFSNTNNSTFKALKERFKDENYFEIESKVDFSSTKKYCSITLKDEKVISLGACEVLTKDENLINKTKEYSKDGIRVLLLKKDEEDLAFILLKDKLRKSAKDTISFFNENGVNIKIISGDNLETVTYIAKESNVLDYEKGLNCLNLDDEELKKKVKDTTIFARVSPEQKLLIVEELQKLGHKVAMTGDGVNDLLALRKADSSITFEKASGAAKSCANVVLLDNDFSHLKDVVYEGRRVVNNIRRSATLFSSKNMCITLLAILLLFFKKGATYISLENFWLCEMTVLAFGGFFLSLEKNKEPIKKSFFSIVLPHALSGGTIMALSVFSAICFAECDFIDLKCAKAMISITTTLSCLITLAGISYPFSKYRITILCISIFISIILVLLAPTALLSGEAISLKDIFSSTTLNEMFRPRNVEIFKNFVKSPLVFVLLGFILFLGVPLYFGLDLGYTKLIDFLKLKLKRNKNK